jgi:hypothetical protein
MFVEKDRGAVRKVHTFDSKIYWYNKRKCCTYEVNCNEYGTECSTDI